MARRRRSAIIAGGAARARVRPQRPPTWRPSRSSGPFRAAIHSSRDRRARAGVGTPVLRPVLAHSMLLEPIALGDGGRRWRTPTSTSWPRPAASSPTWRRSAPSRAPSWPPRAAGGGLERERRRRRGACSRSGVERLRTAHDRLADREAEVGGSHRGLRDRLRLDAPERSVERLDGNVPVALLPVRIETRFADGGTSAAHPDLPGPGPPRRPRAGAHRRRARPAPTYWQRRWAAVADAERADARRGRRWPRSVRPPRAR